MGGRIPAFSPIKEEEKCPVNGMLKEPGIIEIRDREAHQRELFSLIPVSRLGKNVPIKRFKE